MLQISQTENPMCSATIDQMRLRLATTLPVEFQNVSSSGLQSEIQLWFGVLIRDFLSDRALCRSSGSAQRHGGELREAPVRRCRNSNDWLPMDGGDGVDHQLFKLRAKLVRC